MIHIPYSSFNSPNTYREGKLCIILIKFLRKSGSGEAPCLNYSPMKKKILDSNRKCLIANPLHFIFMYCIFYLNMLLPFTYPFNSHRTPRTICEDLYRQTRSPAPQMLIGQQNVKNIKNHKVVLLKALKKQGSRYIHLELFFQCNNHYSRMVFK